MSTGSVLTDEAALAEGRPYVAGEDDLLEAERVGGSGYVQSKWVGEAVVRLAGERGVPVSIYRPGLITGDVETGACGSDDAFWNMVRAIVVATLRGMRFVMDDPAKAALVYVEASPTFKGKEELMKRILANYTERTYKGQITLGAMDAQRLANLQKFYKSQGFIEAELPVDELYSNDFIK